MQPPLVVLVFLSRDVAGVDVRQQGVSLVPRSRLHDGAPVGLAVGTGPTEEEGPGIARIVQQLEDAPVIQRGPQQLALARPRAHAAGEEYLLLPEHVDRRPGRPGGDFAAFGPKPSP